MRIIFSAFPGAAEKAARIALQILAGELANGLAAARLACRDMVRLAEGYDFRAVGPHGPRCARQKDAAVIDAGEKATELAGGRGVMGQTGIGRLLRDLPGARFPPPPESRQRLFAGRVGIGTDPVAGNAVTREAQAA